MRTRTVQIATIPMIGPDVSALSDGAFRLWVTALCWQSTHDQDGWISFPVAKYLARRSTKRLVAELVDAGFWEHLGDDEYRMVRELHGFELWRPGPGDRTRPVIDPDLRLAVYERDGYRCLNCLTTEDLSLDHVVHWSKDGKDTYENLRTLCRSCNSARHTRTDLEWLGADL